MRAFQALAPLWQSLAHGAARAAIALNYHLGNYRDAVWLFGDGRSGTTWVSDLINPDKRYREMFEPFHPKWVRGMEGLGFHQYIRPDDAEHPFRSTATAVFTGRFQDPRVDQENRRLWYRGLLIKDVFANLFACWAARRFPQMKLVLLIRNPFAVAVSRMKNKDWQWMTDPAEFLSRKPLVEDYLHPFEGVIRGVGDDYIQRQVLVWAILHYVPLAQFQPGRLHIVFYEEMAERPEQELPRLFHHLRPDRVEEMTRKAMNILTLPSRVAGGARSGPGGKWPIGRWKAELSAEQVRAGLEILAHFGLDQLYGDGVMPRPDLLLRGQKTGA
jgi:hypothetical protein